MEMENPIWFPCGWTFISHLRLRGALCSGLTTGVWRRAKYHDTRISRRPSLVRYKVTSKNRGACRDACRDYVAAWADSASGKIAGGFPKAAGSRDGEPGPSRVEIGRGSGGPAAAQVSRSSWPTRNGLPRKPVP